MHEVVDAGDDGGADRLANRHDSSAAGRTKLLVAGALFVCAVVVRFLTLYSLDGLLATFGLGYHPPFPSLAWVANDLAHTLANAVWTGLLLLSVLLVLWHFWSARRRLPT